MRDRRADVVGGANSAGQAALHLARYAGQVTLLVRRPTLKATMSDYLVRQIDATPNIVVRHETEAVGGHGTVQLTGLTLRDRRTGRREDVHADALFALIGAEPHTAWMPDTLRRDQRGFILTGSDLVVGGNLPPKWLPERPPAVFETSVPGIFAIGDVRQGSVKRVASSVGEGSVAARILHDYLGLEA